MIHAVPVLHFLLGLQPIESTLWVVASFGCSHALGGRTLWWLHTLGGRTLWAVARFGWSHASHEGTGKGSPKGS